MNTNKKLVIRLVIVIFMSIASSMKLHAMQEGWQSLELELRGKIIGLSSDKQQVINFLAWRPQHTFSLPSVDDRISSVAVGDGILVTASSDCTVKVWDKNNYKEIIAFEEYDPRISSVAVGDGILVTAFSDGTVKVLDKNNYKEITTLKVWDENYYYENTTLKVRLYDRIVSLAVNDGIIVIGSFGGIVKVWDKNNYKEITTLKVHSPGQVISYCNISVNSVAVNGDIIVISFSDGTVKVLDRNNYKEIITLDHRYGTSILSVAVNDDIIVTGLGDGTAKVLDRNNYKEITTLDHRYGASILSVAVNDDIIVTGSFDGTVKLWDRNNYKEIATLGGNVMTLKSLVVADGIIVTLGFSDHRAMVYDMKPFAGSVESNPLLWILSYATTQQWDFLKHVCDLVELNEIEEGEFQVLCDRSTAYFDFPEEVRHYLCDRLQFA